MGDLIVRESTDVESIRARILTVRGIQVMLDRDLAELYGVPTGALNQAVKRNKNRFPDRFMFQLSDDEFQKWKSQIVISNLSNVAKFNSQYPQLALRFSENFHDRFLILDDKELYLIGASLKDLGKKCFGFTKMDAAEIPHLKSRV